MTVSRFWGRRLPAFRRCALIALVSILAMVTTGCGTTREFTATQQLLLSDAVDQSVSHIDFSPLAGERVYLDTQYVSTVKTPTFVNSDYIISSVRQQMMSAGVQLYEDIEDAEYVVEARVGTLGSDGHDVNYGLPPNNVLSAAANALPGVTPLPTIPEISLARKTEDVAAAKIALFAYRKESRERVWQSGVSVARSRAQARWLLGAGPFQNGSVYKGTYLAGERLKANPFADNPRQMEDQEANYRSAEVFEKKLRRKIAQMEPEATTVDDRMARLPETEQPAVGSGADAGETAATSNDGGSDE